MAIRFDIGSLRKPRRKPNGYMDADGYATRIGIFVYRNPDGTTRRELRPPDEVFKAASLESLARVAVTDSHPPEMLSSANTAKYQRGTVGEGVARDSDYVRAPLTLTDAQLIAKVEAGKTALSAGYTCNLDSTPGEWNGEKYDAVQRDIVYNHLAIVDVARGGPEIRIRMDAADAVMVLPKETVRMETIRLDGVDYEVTPQAKQAIAREQGKAQARIDAAEAEARKATEQRDRAQALADAEKERADKEKRRADAAEDPKALDARVAARASLLTEAAKVLGAEKLDGLSPREIKVKVLTKLGVKNLAADASDAYVDGRYDSALEALPKVAIADANRAALTASTAPRADGESAEDAARKRNQEWAKNAWKSANKN